METKKIKSLEFIEELKPLFTLRYSETYKNLYNLVYKLDYFDAYEQDLVKNRSKYSIYFIVETKWDKEEVDLTDIEKGKIHCAERYFETINENVESEVAFSWVNSWNKFTQEIKKKKDSLSLA